MEIGFPSGPLGILSDGRARKEAIDLFENNAPPAMNDPADRMNFLPLFMVWFQVNGIINLQLFSGKLLCFVRSLKMIVFV